MQSPLNLDREQLGLNRSGCAGNAPPVLALTTVALGGFRGLISNLLWIRANDLQGRKVFRNGATGGLDHELEPHFSQVWLFQGWNMAYNISVNSRISRPLAVGRARPGVVARRWPAIQSLTTC